MKLLPFLIIACFIFPKTGFSKKVLYEDEPLKISLTHGKYSLLRFPLPIKTISNAGEFDIQPADQKSPEYSLMRIAPRFKGSTDQVTVILADNSVIELDIGTNAKSGKRNHNGMYDIIIEPKTKNSGSQSNQENRIDELELIKAMIRNDMPMGFQWTPKNQEIETGLENAKGTLINVYSSPHLIGYEFIIENQSYEEELVIDIKSLSFGIPNKSILSQIDQKIIPARNPATSENSTTYLRVVAKPSASLDAFKLPMGKIKLSK